MGAGIGSRHAQVARTPVAESIDAVKHRRGSPAPAKTLIIETAWRLRQPFHCIQPRPPQDWMDSQAVKPRRT
jgi:hypothetical protein